MAQNSTSWERFPPYIRSMILGELLNAPRSTSLSPFATVSQEWQTLIERHTFARIRLTPARISHLESYVSARRQAYVHYIWFCVELEAYNCSTCAPTYPEDYVSDADNLLIKTTLDTLFATLSKWLPNGNLVLDITTYSPSDSEHYFPYLTFRPDTLMESTAEVKFCEHPMLLGNNLPYPADRIISRVFEPVMLDGPFGTDEEEDQWWQGLPSVPAVTGFLLRQQNYRQWKPKALALMFAHFPQLREIHYEPWREWDRYEQTLTDRAYESLLESINELTHPNLRKLVLFENFDEQYAYSLASGVPRSLELDCEPVRTSGPAVCRKVARQSLGLEHLSASFIVEASHFFRNLHPSWTWPRLTSLVLTSLLLSPKPESQADVDALLESAAAAAMKMPKLQNLEIWNGGEGLAGTFQYRSAPPSITWRGTWAHPFPPSVVQAWKAVAAKNRGNGDNTFKFLVVNETLKRRLVMKSHGDAIHYLKVSPSVIRPVSLQQIRLKDRGRKKELDILAEIADDERQAHDFLLTCMNKE